MRKLTTYIAIAVLFTSCQPEEEVDPGASKCYITGIQVNTFPTSDNGAQWDVSTGEDQYADVTFQLSNSTEVIYKHDKHIEDAFTDDLPFQLTMDDYLLSTMNEDYGVLLYDYDVTSADDFIGGGYFNPNDYKVKRLSSININTDNVDIDVLVKWKD